MIRKTPTIRILFLLGDIGILYGAFGVSYILRFLSTGARAGYVPNAEEFVGAVIIMLLVWIAAMVIFGVYKKESISLVDEWGKLFGSTVFTFVIFLALLFVYHNFWFSRQVILTAALIIYVSAAALRGIGLLVQQAVYRCGWFCTHAIIFGKGEDAEHLVRTFTEAPELGFRVEGIYSTTEEVRAALALGQIQEVFIANRELATQQVLDFVTDYSLQDVQFRVVPGIFDLVASRVSLSEAGETPLISIRTVGLRGGNAVLKRASDLVLVALLFPFVIIFGLLCALMIAIETGTPIFIRQKRIGVDGNPFDLLKFRSMRVGAEDEEMLLRKESGSIGTTFKLADDPRMTRVGKWLRRFSLDELPQLWNVVKGEMSLVGPRPCLPHEFDRFSAWEKKRVRVKPGITGLWQVSGRSNLSFSEMVRLDLYYIENWSLWLDFKILLRTIPVVALGIGAY